MTTVDMKRLGKDHQLSCQSHAEIISGLEELVARLSGDGETFLGRKLRTGYVLNGLLLLLKDMGDEERLRIGRRAIRRTEHWMLDRGVPDEARGLEGAGGDDGGGDPDPRPGEGAAARPADYHGVDRRPRGRRAKGA